MANNVLHLLRRDTAPHISTTIASLLIVLLVLLITSLLLVAALLILRHRRRARKAVVTGLPLYNDKRASTSSTNSHHRRVAVRPSQSIHIYSEKGELLGESSTDPSSSSTSLLPEIRITFPEEIDASGNRQSGRVVVVHVGESGVGLEPVAGNLPSYEQNVEAEMQSVDLERVGGLVEKKRAPKGWQ